MASFLCRGVLQEFTAECTRLKDRLLPEMAKLLELDDDYFGDQFGDKADTHARFSYYPPCPRPDLVFGLKPQALFGTAMASRMSKKSEKSPLNVSRQTRVRWPRAKAKRGI